MLAKLQVSYFQKLDEVMVQRADLNLRSTTHWDLIQPLTTRTSAWVVSACMAYFTMTKEKNSLENRSIVRSKFVFETSLIFCKGSRGVCVSGRSLGLCDKSEARPADFGWFIWAIAVKLAQIFACGVWFLLRSADSYSNCTSTLRVFLQKRIKISKKAKRDFFDAFEEIDVCSIGSFGKFTELAWRLVKML